MYLRNLNEYNQHSGKLNLGNELLKIVLFAVIIIIALLASSLTETESGSLLSKESGYK